MKGIKDRMDWLTFLLRRGFETKNRNNLVHVNETVCRNRESGQGLSFVDKHAAHGS